MSAIDTSVVSVVARAAMHQCLKKTSKCGAGCHTVAIRGAQP